MKLSIIETGRKPAVTDPDYVEYYSSPYLNTPYYQEAVRLLRAISIAYNPLNGDTTRDVKRKMAIDAWKQFISRVNSTRVIDTGSSAQANQSPDLVANSFWDGASGQSRRTALGLAANADIPGIMQMKYADLSPSQKLTVRRYFTGK